MAAPGSQSGSVPAIHEGAARRRSPQPLDRSGGASRRVAVGLTFQPNNGVIETSPKRPTMHDGSARCRHPHLCKGDGK